MTEHPSHDSAYKEFFSDPRMVVGLMTDLIPNNFSMNLDFSTLTRVQTNYVTDDLRQRFNDVVWKVKWKNSWAYLLLMLEFQSQPDWLMALRITQYTCLLYSDLAKSEPVKTTKSFPAVLPIVIYNGSKTWNAVQNVSDLIEPFPYDLQKYQPHQEYCLLDMGRMPEELLRDKSNLAALLIRLERAKSLEEVQTVVKDMCDILYAPENQRLRRMLALWVRVLMKRSGIIAEDVPAINDLTEVPDMLAEACAHWKQDLQQQWIGEWKNECINHGVEIGEARGEAKGKAQGLYTALNMLLRSRFGASADDVSLQLASVSDPGILESLIGVASLESLDRFKEELSSRLNRQ